MEAVGYGIRLLRSQVVAGPGLVDLQSGVFLFQLEGSGNRELGPLDRAGLRCRVAAGKPTPQLGRRVGCPVARLEGDGRRVCRGRGLEVFDEPAGEGKRVGRTSRRQLRLGEDGTGSC